MLIRDELRRCGFEESVAAGVVLTGGSAKMEGAVELAEEIFHMPVRLGSPAGRDRARRRGDATRSTPRAWVSCFTAGPTPASRRRRSSATAWRRCGSG